jgi:hypothetical protein
VFTLPCGQLGVVIGDVAGLLIGAAPGEQRPVATVEIPPGTLVCLYTDGLIERRGEPIDDGLARLCQAVTAQPPDAACATVMAAWWAASPPTTTSPCSCSGASRQARGSRGHGRRQDPAGRAARRGHHARRDRRHERR